MAQTYRNRATGGSQGAARNFEQAGSRSKSLYSESQRRNLAAACRPPAAGGESRRLNPATSSWSAAVPDTAMSRAFLAALQRKVGAA